jgi:hypothetical protein
MTPHASSTGYLVYLVYLQYLGQKGATGYFVALAEAIRESET